MKRLMVVGLVVLMLAACGDDTVNTITGPTVEVPVVVAPLPIAGNWESIFRTDNVPTGVFSMTLIQEGSVAVGAWAEPTNGYDGSVTVTLQTGTSKVIAFLGMTGCAGTAELRGDIAQDAQSMTLDGPGFAADACIFGVVVPQGIRLALHKTTLSTQ